MVEDGTARGTENKPIEGFRRLGFEFSLPRRHQPSRVHHHRARIRSREIPEQPVANDADQVMRLDMPAGWATEHEPGDGVSGPEPEAGEGDHYYEPDPEIPLEPVVTSIEETGVIIKARSLKEYLEAVGEIYEEFGPGQAAGQEGPDLWFRGQQAGWDLVPAIWRGESFTEEEDVLLSQVRSRAVFTLGRLPGYWETVFLMHQLGLPTRLLAFTADALVALFFAVREKEYGDEEDAVVWCLNPRRLNGPAPGGIRGAIPHAGDESFTPGGAASYLARPLAVYSPLASCRDAAQKTVFVLFPQQAGQPLNRLDDSDQFLCRILIEAGSCPAVREGIARIGVRRELLFPGFDSPGWSGGVTR